MQNKQEKVTPLTAKDGTIVNTNYVETFAAPAVDNGYSIALNDIYAKGIMAKGWSKADLMTAADVQKVIDKGLVHQGVCIRTGVPGKYGDRVVALDFDVPDKRVSKDFVKIVKEERDRLGLQGKIIIRVGCFPKILILARLADDYPESMNRKRSTADYVIDIADNERGKLEVLMKGQQFVAANLHSRTKQPYYYMDEDLDRDDPPTPATVPAKDLLTVTKEFMDALFERTVKLLEEDYCFEKVKRSSSGSRTDNDNIYDEDGNISDVVLDRLVRAKHIKDMTKQLSDSEVKLCLDYIVDRADDYWDWLRVGMALHDIYNGSHEGFLMWDYWSQSSAKYQSEDCSMRWKGFSSDDGGEKVTAGTLIHYARPAIEPLIQNAGYRNSLRLTDLIKSCDNLLDLMGPIADQIKDCGLLETYQRNSLAELLKEKYTSLGGGKLSIGVAREHIAQSVESSLGLKEELADGLGGMDDDGRERVAKRYPFLMNCVYIKQPNMFYLQDENTLLSVDAFNNANGMYMLSPADLEKGKSRGAHKASDLALNVARIARASNIMYAPYSVHESCKNDKYRDWRDPRGIFNEFFRWRDKEYVNSYQPMYETLTDDDMFKHEKMWSESDMASVETILEYIDSQVSGKVREREDGDVYRERDLLLSAMKMKMLHPSWKPRYCWLLVGPEGTGKSTMTLLFKSLFGEANVNIVASKDVTDSKFNGWIADNMCAVIEEMKTEGESGHVNKNALKNPIESDVVSVEKKYMDAQNVLNFSWVVINTNYNTALPINEDDSRYCVGFSKWETREQVEAFLGGQDPEYFDRVRDAIDVNGEGIKAFRWWLANKFEYHPEFDPNGRAPKTDGRTETARESAHWLVEAVQDLIEASVNPLICRDYISVTQVIEELVRSGDVQESNKVRTRSALQKILRNAPFNMGGDFRYKKWISPEQKKQGLRQVYHRVFYRVGVENALAVSDARSVLRRFTESGVEDWELDADELARIEDARKVIRVSGDSGVVEDTVRHEIKEKLDSMDQGVVDSWFFRGGGEGDFD